MPGSPTIPLDELLELQNNHVNNPDLPFISATAAISLQELRNFLSSVGPDCKAIQVFFVRYPMVEDGNANGRIESAGKDQSQVLLSQVSLAFTPAKIVEGHPDWIVEPVTNDDGKIVTLRVCDPELMNETGLCPPKGNCPRKETSSSK